MFVYKKKFTFAVYIGNMEKHIFKSYMDDLIKQLEFDDKFSSVMAELFDSPDGLMYQHGHLIDSYIALLEQRFDDVEGTISWYVFDMGMKGGKIVTDGKEYLVDSLDSLYEYLNRDNG